MTDILRIGAAVSFSFWMGGLIVSSIIAWAAHKRGEPVISIILDRWLLIWGAAAAGFFLFSHVSHRREPRILLAGIFVGFLFLLTAHLVFILHHQMKEVRRKGSLPEFHGTVHKQLIELTLQRLSREALFLQGIAVVMGLLVFFFFLSVFSP